MGNAGNVLLFRWSYIRKDYGCKKVNNFDKSLTLLLSSEGGYVNHPSDPGGETNLGVTKAVWENWIGHAVKDMRGLTPEMVAPLYRQKYWDACKCDLLPTGLDYMVFDFAVNAGVSRSTKTLQSAVGAAPDGDIGPKTLQAVMSCSKGQLVDKFSAAKEAFYRSLPTFAVFCNGWINRINDVKANVALLLKPDLED